MASTCLVDLGQHERNGYVLGARLPASDPAYSKYLDIGFNRLNTGWTDPAPHFHTHCDEFLVVLRGGIEMRVANEVISVEAGQLIGLRAGVAHQVVNVRPPVENFLIRTPGGGADKVSLPEQYWDHPDEQTGGTGGVIRLNLRQPFDDYPLGACLPENHPNYSPYLDFTCVWGVDPTIEWKYDDLHAHQFREEYFIVLRGQFDIQVDGVVRPVTQGQILGLRPPVVHQVVGGRGPLDLLFVRVPGGRGDKVVLQKNRQ